MTEYNYKQHENGIYFNLPMADYLADTAMSATGVKTLLQSPLAYWMDSHMNPDRRSKADTDATSLGTYVHDILLQQGGRYVKKPATYINEKGEVKKWNGNANKCKEWESLLPEGTLIISDAMDHAAKEIIKAYQHHGLHEDLTGGAAEVSFFWTTASGNRCKIRLDYLNKDFAVDLKTYANQRGNDVITTIAKSIGAEKYHVNAVWYAEGIKAMIAMIKKRGYGAVVSDDKNDELIDALKAGQDTIPYWFHFLETGGVPNIHVRQFTKKCPIGTPNGYYMAAEQAVNFATGLYALKMKEFGADKPWYDPVKKDILVDEELQAARWAFQ